MNVLLIKECKKFMIKKIIFLFVFSFIVVALNAQKIKVIDYSNLQPIKDVLITSQKQSITTNSKGVADISKFSEQDTLMFQHISFQWLWTTKAEILRKGSVVFLSDNVIKLDEIVLSAFRTADKQAEIPYAIKSITVNEIRFQNPQTSGELLAQSGNVFVQQSQMGGGSPVLRGFEANKVLLVIDGVRMNNAVYRGGHLQNVITIDPNAMDKTEIIYGPGSVVYGSDALGGVMHFYTKSPQRAIDTGKVFINGSGFTRYATANQEKSGGVMLNIGLQKWAFLTNIAYKDLGDLRTGHIRNPFYGDWGKRKWYVERIDGKDSVIEHKDVDLQKYSGYQQVDVLQKILFAPSENLNFTANIQYSNSSDIPRYDRLTQVDSKGKPKYAEWYYGPQQRLLTALQINWKANNKVFDELNAVAAFQNVLEDRINRKFEKLEKRFQKEKINVLSLNVDLLKRITDKHKLRYGFEITSNAVSSEAFNLNIENGEKQYDNASRYPDKSNTMNAEAFYLSHHWNLNSYLVLTEGIRINAIQLQSEYTDTMMRIMQFPFDKKITQQSNAVNGSIGLVVLPGYDWKLSLMGSSGFRAPNVDDIGKVNDSKGSDQIIIVPNPEIKPEYAYNVDFSIQKIINKKIRINGTVFYTLLKDAIITESFKFNGADSLVYDGSLCQVLANTNGGEAFVYGFQAELAAQVTKAFSINSNLNYAYGRISKDDVPLDHIPPVFGQTTFRMEIKKFRGDFYLMYNGWKCLRDYNLFGEDNIGMATAYGTPAWLTLNFKTSYQINRFVNLQAGLENILDEHYRKFASGVSAPGRNLVLAMRVNY